MKKSIFSVSFLLTLLSGALLPSSSVLALTKVNTSASGLRTINDVTDKFTNLGNTFIEVLIAFAVIWIIFNVVRYLIVGADSEEKRKTARQAIIWGIIGLAIILSIWGLVNIVLQTFKFNDNNAPVNQFPSVPSRSGGGGSVPSDNLPPFNPGGGLGA
jgi:hypothetical protein